MQPEPKSPTLLNAVSRHSGQLIQALPHPTAILHEGRILLTNEAMARLTGYSITELTALSPDQVITLIHPQDREPIRQALQALHDGQSPTTATIRILQKDGESRWVEIHAAPFRCEDHLFTLVTCTDITDREEIAQTLWQTQQEQNEIFENLPHPTMILAPDHRILAANRAARTFLNLPAEQILGQYCYELLHQSDAPPPECPLKTSLFTHTTETVEMRLELSNRILLISCTPIYNQQGEIDRVIHIATDITERVRAEEALAESEERYRKLVDTAPFGIAIHQDGKLVFVNESGARMLGAQSAEELIGKPIRQFVHPDDWPPSEERIRRMIAGETGLYPARGRYIRMDGSELPVEVYSAPFTYHGRPAFIIIARDITAELQEERERWAHYRQLKLLNQLGRAFVATMSPVEICRITHQTIPQVLPIHDFAFFLCDWENRQLTAIYSSTPLPNSNIAIPDTPDQSWTTAILEGRTEITPDSAEDITGFLKQAPLGSLLAYIPVSIGENVIGLLAVTAPGWELSPQAVELLGSVGSQMGLALENARLFERERREREHAEALYHASLALGESLDLETTLRRIFKTLANVLQYDSASILILTDNHVEMIFGIGYEDPELTLREGSRLLNNSPLLQQLIRTRKSIISGDVRTLDGWIWVPGAEHIRSWIGVPMIAQGELIGALMVDSKQTNAFSPEDLHLVESLALSAAQAVLNARLYRDLQRHAEELESRVAERTADLRTRVAEVEQLNRALINVLEDSQALNRNLEATTKQLREANEELEAFVYSVSHDLRAPLRAIEGFAQAVLEDAQDRLDEESRQYLNHIIRAAQQMDELAQSLLAYSRIGRIAIRMKPISLDEILDEALSQLQDAIDQADAQISIDRPLPTVLAHRSVLIQIVINLLSNAIKFVSPGTRPEVHIRAEETNTHVRLWVEDNGIGIPPEHHERIFHVFERLHGPESYPGTGIGLAIVRRGIERMGGRVGLESTVGQGSRFWIEIPKPPEEEKDDGHLAHPPG